METKKTDDGIVYIYFEQIFYFNIKVPSQILKTKNVSQHLTVLNCVSPVTLKHPYQLFAMQQLKDGVLKWCFKIQIFYTN